MKFLRNLFGKKPAASATEAPTSTTEAAPAPFPSAQRTGRRAADAAARAAVPPTMKSDQDDPMATTQILQNLAERLKEPAATGIWDIEEKQSVPKAQAPAAPSLPGPPAAPTDPLSEMATRPPARPSRRNKTRLIGFDTSETSVVDLFGEEEGAAETNTAPTAPAVTFPVGWVLVIQGPGRGHAFPLSAGMSSVGRGDDQTVRLNFGDAAISRTGHASILYDEAARGFQLGQGGKSNIVRLNGKPVISNVPLKDGDDIKIGETVLKLKTLCGPDFDWTDTDGEEDDDDVAIA